MPKDDDASYAVAMSVFPDGDDTPLTGPLWEQLRQLLDVFLGPAYTAFIMGGEDELTAGLQRRHLNLLRDTRVRGVDARFLVITRYLLRRGPRMPEFEWNFYNGWRDDLTYWSLTWDGRLICREPDAVDQEEWDAGKRDYTARYIGGEEAKSVLDQLMSIAF